MSSAAHAPRAAIHTSTPVRFPRALVRATTDPASAGYNDGAATDSLELSGDQHYVACLSPDAHAAAHSSPSRRDRRASLALSCGSLGSLSSQGRGMSDPAFQHLLDVSGEERALEAARKKTKGPAKYLSLDQMQAEKERVRFVSYMGIYHSTIAFLPPLPEEDELITPDGIRMTHKRRDRVADAAQRMLDELAGKGKAIRRKGAASAAAGGAPRTDDADANSQSDAHDAASDRHDASLFEETVSQPEERDGDSIPLVMEQPMRETHAEAPRRAATQDVAPAVMSRDDAAPPATPRKEKAKAGCCGW